MSLPEKEGKLLKPCMDCGELTYGTRCEDCKKISPVKKHRKRKNFRERGYDAEFERLSKKSKKLQPFCLFCNHPGSKENPLTCDHKNQESWEKKNRGEKLTLSDVQVLCRECNSRKGAARKTI